MFYGWLYFIQNLLNGGGGPPPAANPVVFVVSNNARLTVVPGQ